MNTTQVDKYVILSKLGKGGMGEVYLANDPELDRNVAIKVLTQDRLSRPEQLERFQREARMLTNLEHRAIVPLYDFGGLDAVSTNEGAQPYLVMRYMSGGSVAELLNKQRPLSLEDALDISGRIGAALDFAHNKDFIHRDIKPANFLLDEEGKAYLADFGIGKLVTDDNNHITREGTTIGTYAYMSPEQITAPQKVSGSTDIYGLGIVLFELLTGRVPFRGDSIQMMYGHLDRDVPSIHELNNELPPEFDDIFRRALAKEPDQRYETAGEMLSELKTASTESSIDLDRIMRERDRVSEEGVAPLEHVPATESVEVSPSQAETVQTAPQPINYTPVIIGSVLALILTAFLLIPNSLIPNNLFSPEPTATLPLVLAPTEAPTETPTMVATTPPPPTEIPIYSANLRLNGDSSTAFYRDANGPIEEIPNSGILPLLMEQPRTVQVNTSALIFDLPNSDRLYIDALTDITLVLQDESNAILVTSSKGQLILESRSSTTFIIDGVVEAVVQNGRLGIIRPTDQPDIEFHCLEGSCTITPTQETAVSLPIGSFTAVSASGTTTTQGQANYTPFTNIINSVLGALPTVTPLPTATATPSPLPPLFPESYITEPLHTELGQTASGTPIELVQFGNGPNAAIFIGGIHSAYAPSSVRVAEEAIAYYTEHFDEVPPNVTLYIIPNLNPDADGNIAQANGRLNDRGVELNRNWDCRWRANATVLGNEIPGSGGASVHSEPESQALLSLIEDVNPRAVIIWGAANRDFGLVAPGACEVQTLVSVPLSIYYGIAAKYDYPETEEVKANVNLTGDLTNYLDKIGIPAAFVLMTSFTDIEFERELAGIQAVLTAVNTETGLSVTPTPQSCEQYDLDNWGDVVDFIIIRPIGCQRSNIFSPDAAFQEFQGGWMLWREDQEKVYVMYYNRGNSLSVYSVDAETAEAFESDSARLDGALGYIHATVSEAEENLGNPLAEQEPTEDFEVQDFDNGMIFSFSNGDGYFAVINTNLMQWRKQQ